jgi:hypothetical protein
MAKKSKQDVCAKIYAALLAHCPSAELPPPWDGLTVHASCFYCPGDHEAALADLQRRFERRELFQSKIVVRTKGGGMRLIRELRQPANYLVSLRKTEGAAPFDIVTDAGCISGNRWPAIAALEDHSMREDLEDLEHRLLLVFSMTELVLCRTLKIPAALSVGLDHGNQELLDALTPLCGWDARERDIYLGKISQEELDAEAMKLVPWAEDQAAQIDQTPMNHELEDDSESETQTEAISGDGEGREPRTTVDEDTKADTGEAARPSRNDQRPGTRKPIVGESRAGSYDASCELVILGWQLTNMSNEEPDELDELVSYLNEVDRYLGIELGGSVDIWTPKKVSFILIEKRLEHGVLRGAVEAVLDSYQEEAFSLYSYRDTSRLPPTNFAEAAAHLREVFRGGGEGTERFEDGVKQARAWFERFLDQDVVAPMIAEAAGTADPIRKSNLLVAAELGRLLHRETAVADYRMERVAITAAQRHDVPFEMANIKSCLALVDRLMAVTKELYR